MLDEDKNNNNKEDEDLDNTEEALRKCQAEKNEYLDGWQRARADYVNAKKNEEKIREELLNYNTEKLIKEFLPIIDDFNLAFKEELFKNLGENYKKGIEAIAQKFIKILEHYEVTSFNSAGEQFNPERHEAIAMEEVETQEKDNIILEEFQKGYNIKDKLLRPAKVKVGIYKTTTNH